MTDQRDPAPLWDRTPEAWDDAITEPEPEIDYEVGAEPMTAAASAAIALRAPWRPACTGCGQRSEKLPPLDAVAVLRALERRCASLLHHPADSLAYRRGEQGSWSAMEPASQVSLVLGTANRRLRVLLGEEDPQTVVSPPEGANLAWATGRALPSAELAALARSVRDLVSTIEAATTQDWDRPRPDSGATAAEMVWLALHAATHHLEDAELILDAALAGGPAAWSRVEDPTIGQSPRQPTL